MTGQAIPRGVDLFTQGNTPTALYVVVRGSLKVTRASGNGRYVITELLFPGDICGALCILGCERLAVSAVALEDVEILWIEREDFQRLSNEHPGLMSGAVQCCRHKFREQRDMLVDIALERVEQRAARALLLMARSQSAGEMRARLKVTMGRRDFSELIGTTLETAVRVLSDFRRRGLVKETAGELIVLDEPGLSLLACED